EALAQHGVADPARKLQEFMSPGRNALQKQLRKLFVARILAPVALHLLTQYETSVNMVGETRDRVKFRNILREHAETLQHVIRFFEEP
ncbi:virulence factor SrfB, partial [Stenotrophomonas maltophilia]|uniref:virulence factor SrfB n=1 Tax=Stenotrophomonas maltophilia TaxID=40324 RepID=UPI0013D9A92C